MDGMVVSVSLSASHTMRKSLVSAIDLVAGLGVAGDAHMGATVKHRSRVAKDPTQPNLRQVHLIHSELLTDLAAQGLDVEPGQMGENILTRGVPLLDLPADTVLSLGDAARVRITGLRNPCLQLNGIQPGLMQAVLGKAPDGSLIRKAGVMAVVEHGGLVSADDPIRITLPDRPHRRLAPV